MKQKLKIKWRKIARYYQENGAFPFIRHVLCKLFHLEEVSYSRWRRKKRISLNELDKQKKENFPIKPLISIVVPVYCTPLKYLTELIESIRNQSYVKWELCLSDGSGKNRFDSAFLDAYTRKDNRIKYISSSQPLSISANTNCALKIASGDYLVFADHDDLLAPNALYECVKIINKYPDTEILYTDEDKVTRDGKNYFQPHFKSDFNIDLLRSMNYICHMFLVKRTLQSQVGYLREEFNGAQDYDFVLRCIEKSDKIYHIPKILYHWRAHKDSTAENPQSKMYAFEAGRRAIEAHLQRLQIAAKVEMGKQLGIYRVKYQYGKEPLVSVVIPNQEHVEDLKKCVNSLLNSSSYNNLELLIIENGSKQDSTFEFYKNLQEKYDKVKLIIWEKANEFNYSAINNFGAKKATGEYLLFLNNDIEIINSDSIGEMVSHVLRPDVGVVGAKLYYKDDTIQHAGVILGLGGIAGHAFCGLSNNENSYFSRGECIQNYSAVTAACMMMPKALFEEIGGFDENLKVAFNDIDLCMKIRKKNKLIVYTPYAELYHFESKSRGLEDTNEKVERFNQEVNYFAEKWRSELKIGDPYYNMNLTLKKHDFSLKEM